MATHTFWLVLKMTNESTYAFIRKDLDPLREQPVIKGFDATLIDWKHERFICWQPEELDGQEFNLILYCPVRKIVFQGMSIDFDYETKETEE